MEPLWSKYSDMGAKFQEDVKQQRLLEEKVNVDSVEINTWFRSLG